MGLFGLFNVAVGLGVITKDAISDSIEDSKQREKAIREGKPMYSVNGYKTMSTQTGQKCMVITDYDTYHQWIIDTKTGRKIEDLTIRKNKEDTEKSRREAHEKGEKFYRTCEFDIFPRSASMVYINDDMPGKFFMRISTMEDNNRKFVTYYIEGELVDNNIGKLKKKRVDIGTDYRNMVEYNPDGTIRNKKG